MIEAVKHTWNVGQFKMIEAVKHTWHVYQFKMIEAVMRLLLLLMSVGEAMSLTDQGVNTDLRNDYFCTVLNGVLFKLRIS
jgi:hypothetical protein